VVGEDPYAVAGVFFHPPLICSSITVMREKSVQSLPKDYQLLYDKTEPMNICILPAIYKCRI
jgi:hypothetical protein